MGAKKRPVYRIVVADSRSPRDGRFIESIGFYDPLPDPPKVVVDTEKVREWMRKGARPSDSARHILEREGILPRSPRPVIETRGNGAESPAATATATVDAPAGDAATEAPAEGPEAAPVAAAVAEESAGGE